MSEEPSAVDAMSEEPSAVDAMSEGSSAVDAMSEEPGSAVGGAQRRQHDAGSRNSTMSGRCRKDLSTPIVVTTTGEQPLSRRRQERTTPRTMAGLKTPLGRQQKRRVDALTYSDRPQSSLSILLLVLYKSGYAKCNVADFYEVENSLPNGHSLFLSSFSCLSLSSLFLSGLLLSHTLLS